MDSKRKDLIVAGLFLGDITLALAALARELPSYVQGFDLEKVIPDEEGLRPVRAEADALLAGRTEIDEIPPELTRRILDRAIERGKFLSASRCLDLLGERESRVDGFLAGAGDKLKAGDTAGAARDLVVASNLGSEAGMPLFQYSGPEIHAGCMTAPGDCVTRRSGDEAVSGALAYLLEGEKVKAFLDGLSADARRSLLPHVAMERDEHLREFYAAFAGAHETLESVLGGDLPALKSDLDRAAEVAAAVLQALGTGAPEESSAQAVDRARRVAGGLVKDFGDVDALIGDLQLRRLRRRVTNLLESESELSAAGDAAGAAVALIAEFREKNLTGKIDEVEAALAGLQVGLLGRAVHSQEHWQYLRELAFKYPVSPLMCCIRRLDDRFMVVPVWDGGLTVIIRDFLENEPGGPERGEA
jgi:hypothetical protein